MRSGGNPDSTQDGIVKALRKCGATVVFTTQLGRGAPDLLVGFRRRTFLLEVKGPKTPLEQHQVEWHQSWRGQPVDVVRTPLEALQAVGAVRRTG